MTTITTTRNVPEWTAEVIKRTCRVPALDGPLVGTGAAVVQQLDAVLATIGFKLSAALLAHLAARDEVIVQEYAAQIIAAVREIVGDHVAHNPYFIDFPNNVPDTWEFWRTCIIDTLKQNGFTDEQAAAILDAFESTEGIKVSLLDLSLYGTVQHSYQEMIAHHARLITNIDEHFTILHLGMDVWSEVRALLDGIAACPVPLGDHDLAILTELAPHCPMPAHIPLRENRAVINAARVRAGKHANVDTLTDVLRLAAALSGGDVTLETPTKFTSLPRRIRRLLMAALDHLVATDPCHGRRQQIPRIADVLHHREAWKRLGERLHPHEYDQYPDAQQVFAVARGDTPMRNLASFLEAAFHVGDFQTALRWAANAPGVLMRNMDRLARMAAPYADRCEDLCAAVIAAMPHVSGRVLIQLVQHLTNRLTPMSARVFIPRRGRAHTADDTREPLDPELARSLYSALWHELGRRMPQVDVVVVDPAIYELAVPLTGKNVGQGFRVLPRGSVTQLPEGELLRFFMYWRQAADRTDYDLSVIFLDAQFMLADQVSYTNLRTGFARHSGDITHAEDGATEFIDITLADVPDHIQYIVPQVYVFGGEGFDVVDESMFGFMVRNADQQGLPFEPGTVEHRSDVRNSTATALPLVFVRSAMDGRWYAKWLHLGAGQSARWANQVETRHRTISGLVAGLMGYQNITLGQLLSNWGASGRVGRFMQTTPGGKDVFDELGRPTAMPDTPVTYIGFEAPEDLPEGSRVITLNRLAELIPD